MRGFSIVLSTRVVTMESILSSLSSSISRRLINCSVSSFLAVAMISSPFVLSADGLTG